MKVFKGKTANSVWHQAMSELTDAKDFLMQESRAGYTRELLRGVFEIDDPRQRWVTVRRPGINPAFAIVEVIWILQGRNDSRFLNNWNSKLPKFSGYGDIYHGAYGHRLRQYQEFDQLEQAYHALQNNPDSRQVVLQIWDARLDLPFADGQAKASDIPCNVMAFLKVRNGKLEWTQIARSNDLIRGVPYNFIQFTMLQEIMAGWLGLSLGQYVHIADSLHIYEKDVDDFYPEATFGDEVVHYESLTQPYAKSEEIFKDLATITTELSSSQLTASKLHVIAYEQSFPEGYQNMVYILVAEAARRRKWIDLSVEISSQCTNPLLREAWDNWWMRFYPETKDVVDQHNYEHGG